MQKRNLAESGGNHASADVLAANIAKTILLGVDLVDKDFIRSLGPVHANDLYNNFRPRVVLHMNCIMMDRNIPASGGDLDSRLREFIGAFEVTHDTSRKNMFFSSDDFYLNDYHLWFRTPDGQYHCSENINVGEEPFAYGVAVHEVETAEAFAAFGRQLLSDSPDGEYRFSTVHLTKDGDEIYGLRSDSAAADVLVLHSQMRPDGSFAPVRASTFGEFSVLCSDKEGRGTASHLVKAMKEELVARKMNREISSSLQSEGFSLEGFEGGVNIRAGADGAQCRFVPNSVYTCPDGITCVTGTVFSEGDTPREMTIPLKNLSDAAVSKIAASVRATVAKRLGLDQELGRSRVLKKKPAGLYL